jgi:hypothetical protein
MKHHSIQELVDQQVRRWEEQRKVSERQAREDPKAQHPMIVISREYGAGGIELGRLVATRLKFDFYGQELVEQIAQSAHVRSQVVRSVDERMQDVIDNWIGDQFGHGYFSDSEYLRNLSKVVLTLGRHGRGVIIGRGAQFFLDPRRTLRVRAFASLDRRAELIAEREGIALHEARAKAIRVDAERHAFTQRHFNNDVGDPHLYDLLLNTGTFSLDTSAAIVEQAFRVRFGS